MEQLPLKKEENRSIHAALSQAEQEHWLERPNASVTLRSASFLLDLIFLYLFIHGQHRLFEALSLYSNLMNPFFLGFVDIFLRTSFLFVYLIVSVSEWGGTVGNLLLGLRVMDDQTGRKLSLSRSSNRLVFALATNILSLAIALSRPDRRGLHDLLSRTVIKRVRGRV
ncbi:RDD family protein [bacterium]|nr:RDD family protein [bacterium]